MIAAIGATGHGKTTVAAAITKTLGARLPDLNRYTSAEAMSLTGTEPARCFGDFAAHVEYETERHRYAHLEFKDNADCQRNLITGQWNGAMLVVAATDGLTSDGHEQVAVARQAGISNLVVAITKCDITNDERPGKADEIELRELLSRHGYPDGTVAIVRVSALGMIRGVPAWVDGPARLLTAMDAFVAPPPVDEQPFLMPIDDVFTTAGRVVITGRVERGVVRVGETVDILGHRLRLAPLRTAITSIDVFRHPRDEARPGTDVALSARGLTPEHVERGMAVTRPMSVTQHTEFEAVVCGHPENAGRPPTVFATDRGQRYSVWTADVAGTIIGTTDGERVNPGGVTRVAVRLSRPVPLESGVRFTIRERGRGVAVGRITRILA